LDLVDPAVLQPGRFGTLVPLGLPDPAEREAILTLYLRDSGPELSAQVRAQLRTWTEGWTGAQLRGFAEFLRREAASLQNGSLENLFSRWQNQAVVPANYEGRGHAHSAASEN
jgi:SpoVK/Ycf46/Vps4 family AAA+-type ATPase